MDSESKTVLRELVRHYTAQRSACATGHYTDPTTGLPGDTHGDPAKLAGLAAVDAWFVDAEALVTALLNHEPTHRAIEIYNTSGDRAVQPDGLIDYHSTQADRYAVEDIDAALDPEAEFCGAVASWHVTAASHLGAIVDPPAWAERAHA